eukprot:6470760-Amphidinium_carterae.2
MNASETVVTVVLQSVHISPIHPRHNTITTWHDANIQHQLHIDTTNNINYDHDYQLHTSYLIQTASITTTPSPTTTMLFNHDLIRGRTLYTAVFDLDIGYGDVIQGNVYFNFTITSLRAPQPSHPRQPPQQPE